MCGGCVGDVRGEVWGISFTAAPGRPAPEKPRSRPRSVGCGDFEPDGAGQAPRSLPPLGAGARAAARRSRGGRDLPRRAPAVWGETAADASHTVEFEEKGTSPTIPPNRSSASWMHSSE
eukprot:gene15353-biopygen11223